jgi:hypothetical protein
MVFSRLFSLFWMRCQLRVELHFGLVFVRTAL